MFDKWLEKLGMSWLGIISDLDYVCHVSCDT